MSDDDTAPIKGPIDDPVDDPANDPTVPVKGPPSDEPIEDDYRGSADDALEDERTNHDPNEATLKSLPKLPQDYSTPAAPLNDPLTKDLPKDYPESDSNIDSTERYNEDEADATEVWSEHESNDRKNDALFGDNGPDL